VNAHRTACPLDCPDHCSLVATTRHGQLVSLEGDRRNPFTGGFLCAKVRRFADHVHGAQRLHTPLARIGPKGQGRFSPISWDDALDRIASEMRRVRDTHGSEAILPFSYGGSNGPLTEGIVDRRLFRRLGASRLDRAICAAPSGRAHEGLYGKMPGVSLPDYVHSRLVILWGMNPTASGIHLVPILKRARESGARIVVVDPRQIPLAKGADLHLAVRPGTDVALALGVARWLFHHGATDPAFLAAHACEVDAFRARAEPWTLQRTADVTGIAAGDIEELARIYAETEPAVIRCGWGIERNRNGGSAVAAVLALPAIAGKFGVRGGGFTMSNSRMLPLDTKPLIGAPEPATRVVNMNRLGRALEELEGPRVHLLFVYDANPMATAPEQVRVQRGLSREDLFTVVFDQVMTDTARFADIVLPATTFVEHDELKPGYGAPVLLRSRPVIDRVGESRPNYEVFAALLERLELHRDDDLVDPDALVRALVETSAPETARWTDALEHDGLVVRDPAPVAFVDVFPATSDGRIHLVPEALDREAPGGLYAYRDAPDDGDHPLVLISPATRRTISSTFGQLIRDPAALAMHPTDAAARGLATGAWVRVFNRRGQIRCRLEVTEDVRPGVVAMAKGLWCHSTVDGLTSNALVPDDLADLGGGATFNDARVQVEGPIPTPAPASL
jgi:anaerobic selenocysteine-containing dehydrogenase